MEFTSPRFAEVLDGFSRARILVIGDLMLDEFLWGKVSRISPEAPVPVLNIQRRAFYPGGAANVARNLRALGGQAGVCGVVGKDPAGDQLLRALREDHVGVDSVLHTAQRITTHKTRVCAITRQLHAHLDIEDQQQIVRVDNESHEPLDGPGFDRLAAQIRQEIPRYDAVIIEDYAKGFIDQRLVSLVIEVARSHQKIVAVDPNPGNPCDWTGATLLKPNRREAFLAAGHCYAEGEAAILAAGKVLQARHPVEYLLITLGEAGMLLLEDGQPPYHTPTRAQEVFDVSGAGDTAIAAFTLALASGAAGVEAAEIANHAAGVVVGKLGTAALNVDELRQMFVMCQGEQAANGRWLLSAA